MKIRYEIDHPSIAILIGEAQNSKAFSDKAWGNTSFEGICERFLNVFSEKPKLDLDKAEEIIRSYKITKAAIFDNFALEHILNSLKEYATIKY